MRPVRVLVVDDQQSLRRLIISHLITDPMIEVVGEAANPSEAREAIKALDPDVVTLDVEMPGMDGLDFLEKIMRLRPTPVVMVSSYTTRGAVETLRALELGAVDCVAKPCPSEPNSFAELPEKVRLASQAVVRARTMNAARVSAKTPTSARGKSPSASVPISMIAIGASTGGVEALIDVLSRFPADCPPTVVVQHMPALFTRSFADRLTRQCSATVQEATDGAKLDVGKVLIAPGGLNHLEVLGRDQMVCRLRNYDPVSGHRPSVDVLFHSVAQAGIQNAVGVILTGMGRDGADGLLQMRRRGARTIGQDMASCVVYGMPKAAAEIGAVARQVSLSAIAAEIFSPK